MSLSDNQRQLAVTLVRSELPLVDQRPLASVRSQRPLAASGISLKKAEMPHGALRLRIMFEPRNFSLCAGSCRMVTHASRFSCRSDF